MSDANWLAANCQDLLYVPASARRQAAVNRGARAADEGLTLREIVTGLLDATTVHWSGTPVASTDTAVAVHSRAETLLHTARALLTDAVDGYTRQNRAELDRHDNERAAFVNDLLTGRADPGGLAERAHRYGIRQ
ncbi:hypothetical protein AB0F49_24155 [Micromonospora ureilytica]|uniref:hypothetical protein n=1 Tax=Micromonospora ureilytica TaxID=709868 RepID=UPI0033F14546